MKIEKPFFYNRLQTSIELDEETKEQVLNYFNIKQQEIVPSLNLDTKQDKEPIKEEVLSLTSYTPKFDRNSNEYLEIEFSNSNGSILGRAFSRNIGSIDDAKAILDSYSVFSIDGSVNLYNGKKSLNINKISPFKGDIDPLTLLPSSSHSVEEMLLEMFAYFNELAEPHKSLGLKGLQYFWKEFSMKPAAKRMHHAYLHGLLKHTLGLQRLTRYLKLCSNPYKGLFTLINIVQDEHQKTMLENLENGLSNQYKYLPHSDSLNHLYEMTHSLMEMDGQPIDWDLIIAGEFYHDIGKIFEYSNLGEITNKFEWLFPKLKSDGSMTQIKGGIDMDVIGKLMGHMTPGVMLLKHIIEKFSIDISIEESAKYIHCILAHHGKFEWGSGVKPSTPEAVIMHISDFLDSRWEQDDPTK